jgi:hypothetical protein
MHFVVRYKSRYALLLLQLDLFYVTCTWPSIWLNGCGQAASRKLCMVFDSAGPRLVVVLGCCCS